ncbi:MAG: hypothetical protein JWN64_612 [Parcubacteria group bacterium]|nr:hypothetical protein [Parcubacteria group bacterium]
MTGLFDSVFVKILAAIIVGLIAYALYHALDIYLALTRQDFTNIKIAGMYFTRNDHNRKQRGLIWKGKSDACQSRVFGPTLSIRDIYLKNRFLFVSVVLKSILARPDKPVLSFGKHTEIFLGPIRDRIASSFATHEAKRAAGLPYTETRYQICLIRDLSDDKRTRILKVLLVRQEDIDKLEAYVLDPPAVGNFELFKKIASIYRTRRGESFLKLQITLT